MPISAHTRIISHNSFPIAIDRKSKHTTSCSRQTDRRSAFISHNKVTTYLPTYIHNHHILVYQKTLRPGYSGSWGTIRFGLAVIGTYN